MVVYFFPINFAEVVLTFLTIKQKNSASGLHFFRSSVHGQIELNLCFSVDVLGHKIRSFGVGGVRDAGIVGGILVGILVVGDEVGVGFGEIGLGTLGGHEGLAEVEGYLGLILAAGEVIILCMLFKVEKGQHE